MTSCLPQAAPRRAQGLHTPPAPQAGASLPAPRAGLIFPPDPHGPHGPHGLPGRLLGAGLACLALLGAWPALAQAIPFPAGSQAQGTPLQGAGLAQSPFLPGSATGRVAVGRRMSAQAAARCLGLASDFYRWNELKPSARLLPGCELWLDDPCLLAQASPAPAAAPLPACGQKRPSPRTAQAAQASPDGTGKAPAETGQPKSGALSTPASPARQDSPARLNVPASQASQARQNAQEKQEKQAQPAAKDRQRRLERASGRGGKASAAGSGAVPASHAPDRHAPRTHALATPALGASASGATLRVSGAAGAGRADATPRAAAPSPAGTAPASAQLALRPGSCSAQLAAYLGDHGWQLAWRLNRDIWISAHAAYPGAPAEALKRLFRDLARAGQPCRVTLYSANRVVEVRED